MTLIFCTLESLREALTEVRERARLQADLDRLRDRAGLNVCDERIEVREESAGGER